MSAHFPRSEKERFKPIFSCSQGVNGSDWLGEDAGVLGWHILEGENANIVKKLNFSF
jgi:hypothetical protein